MNYDEREELKKYTTEELQKMSLAKRDEINDVSAEYTAITRELDRRAANTVDSLLSILNEKIMNKFWKHKSGDIWYAKQHSVSCSNIYVDFYAPSDLTWNQLYVQEGWDDEYYERGIGGILMTTISFNIRSEEDINKILADYEPSTKEEWKNQFNSFIDEIFD